MSKWLEEYLKGDMEARKFALRCAVDYGNQYEGGGREVMVNAHRFLAFLVGLPQWDELGPSAREDNHALKREIAALKRENTILKKAKTNGQ